MQGIKAGMQMEFEESPCTVISVLEEDCICVTMPVKEGIPVLPALHSRHKVAFYVDEAQALCSNAEVLSRYREQNQYRMKLMLIEGLYRQDRRRFAVDGPEDIRRMEKVCAAAGAAFPEELRQQPE